MPFTVPNNIGFSVVCRCPTWFNFNSFKNNTASRTIDCSSLLFYVLLMQYFLSVDYLLTTHDYGVSWNSLVCSGSFGRFILQILWLSVRLLTTFPGMRSVIFKKGILSSLWIIMVSYHICHNRYMLVTYLITPPVGMNPLLSEQDVLIISHGTTWLPFCLSKVKQCQHQRWAWRCLK